MKLIQQFIGAVTVISSIGLTLIYLCFTHDIKMPKEQEKGNITIDDLIN